MCKFDYLEQPTLQPWVNVTETGTSRQLFVRNPFYHRIDARGVQLPYIDKVEMTIATGGLIAAKANAGAVTYTNLTLPTIHSVSNPVVAVI